MAMSADEVANARRAQQSANAQMWDGIGSAASAVGGMSFGGGAGGEPKMGMGSGVNPGVLEDEWASSNTNLGYQDWLDSRDED